MSITSRKAVAARALGLVDFTDLGDNSNEQSVGDLCRRAQTDHGNVAAICIWPHMVAFAKKQLAGTGIPIATVVNFPKGDQTIDDTVALTLQAISDGADEVDLVIPYQDLIGGLRSTTKAMVVAIRTATSGKALLKVILETGELKDPGLIRLASEIAIIAGADFIKTSTGKVAVNATLEAAEIMLQAIADSGKPVGFKPAGGIKTTEDCGAYLALADRILGEDWASPATFRFGASSVLDDLLAAQEGKSADTSEGY
ncbi:MAG: deoxyribose-phosphate aldolase [Rhizobiaceae bacterium]